MCVPEELISSAPNIQVVYSVTWRPLTVGNQTLGVQGGYLMLRQQVSSFQALFHLNIIKFFIKKFLVL